MEAMQHDHDLVLRIARLRYEERLPQNEIARRVGVSEASVSRALKKALALGFVEIRVAPHALREAALERELIARFGLAASVVVATRASLSGARRALGGAVAWELERHLEDGAVIGVSDGETTAAVAAGAGRSRHRDLHVLALIGGIGAPEAPSHPGEVCRSLASALGARAWQLPVPAVVDDAGPAAALRATNSVRQVFAMMGRLSAAVVGVGAISEAAAIVRHGVVSQADMAAAGARGAVGTICARFYDAEGRLVPSELDARTLAITLDELKAAAVRLAVAIGPDKLAAIRAALRGRLVTGIGTDAATARLLLGG